MAISVGLLFSVVVGAAMLGVPLLAVPPKRWQRQSAAATWRPPHGRRRRRPAADGYVIASGGHAAQQFRGDPGGTDESCARCGRRRRVHGAAAGIGDAVAPRRAIDQSAEAVALELAEGRQVLALDANARLASVEPGSRL
ncbi:MAG: hypothetical protein E6J90_16070 [Deltaproteobacteria bacterium]|nr:MAG: hypothetical protein E6J91_31570 [Deltaproteobacteria bacterium]TMQ20513.1 MAG: hypothetical protein E6J90_16070 [Deltaproteobacteria bacterium]